MTVFVVKDLYGRCVKIFKEEIEASKFVEKLEDIFKNSDLKEDAMIEEIEKLDHGFVDECIYDGDYEYEAMEITT